MSDEKKLNLLRNKLHMAALIAGVLGWINMIHKPRIAQKWIPRYLYPQRLVRSLLKKGDISNLANAEIAEILYVDYSDDISLTKHKKPELVKRLEDKINGNPNDPASTSSTEYPMLE